MLRKKITTALSLSPRQFLAVLREKLFHALMKITGASSFHKYYDKKNLEQMIENPEWADVSEEQYRKFCPLLSAEEIQSIFAQIFNSEIEDTIAYADNICAHKFDLLGSGFVHVGDEINWQQDFVSGRVWPYVLAKDSFIIDLNDNSDIKIPWELSRHQYFSALGQAYIYTKNEKYALEFKNQVLHWISHNSYKVGANWMCSMDIGLRAISWIWARTFFEGSPSIDPSFWETFHRVLASHGEYVFNNIEDWAGIKNNHYLSNGTALYILGSAFPGLPGSSDWKQKGHDILEECSEKHILDDGVNYEMSTSYHRLVFEFLLTPYLFARRNGDSFSRKYEQKLKQMLKFTAACTKPDGAIALFGDGDNGRCQVMSEYNRTHINDHRYLLCIGAILFGDGALKSAAGRFFNEAFWLCGPSSKALFSEIQEQNFQGSYSFDDGGFYLMSHEDIWCFVDCGPRGIPGAIGVHGHNDVTSFELSMAGESVVIDSGMFSYSGNPQISFDMKSSMGHNLLIVDDQEISTTPFDLWVIGDEALPILFKKEFAQDFSVLEVGHAGYERLAKPVKVRRTFTARGHTLEIIDSVQGSLGEQHQLEVRMHTGLTPIIQGKDIILQGSTHMFRVSCPDLDFEPFFKEENIAESYGRLRDSGYVFGWTGKNCTMPWSGVYKFSIEGTQSSC